MDDGPSLVTYRGRLEAPHRQLIHNTCLMCPMVAVAGRGGDGGSGLAEGPGAGGNTSTAADRNKPQQAQRRPAPGGEAGGLKQDPPTRLLCQVTHRSSRMTHQLGLAGLLLHLQQQAQHLPCVESVLHLLRCLPSRPCHRRRNSKARVASSCRPASRGCGEAGWHW